MSDKYTINKQYHAKKDIDIYIVRLSVRVQKEEFNDLRVLARTYNGYYSSFYGVHGFVFSSEEDSISFGEKLDERLVTFYETSKNDGTIIPINTPNSASNAPFLPTIIKTEINSKWNRKMNEEQTNNYFLSITEYDDWGEKIFKVKMMNLGYYIDKYGQLTISCEICRTDIIDRWTFLCVAIYDSKNRIREKQYVDSLHGNIISKPCMCSCTEIKPSQIGKIKLFWE